MTTEIKRMLAERAEIEAARTSRPIEIEDPAVEEMLNRIKIAAPYINADAEPGKWDAEAKLTMMFFVILTGSGSDARHRAFKWAEKMLDRARRRWLRGLPANPFSKERPA